MSCFYVIIVTSTASLTVPCFNSMRGFVIPYSRLPCPSTFFCLTFSICLCFSTQYSHYTSIAARFLRTMSSLFSPNLIDQSSYRILSTHAKTRPILHDDWSIRLGENRPDSSRKHLATMLTIQCCKICSTKFN